ncbi:MAG TPA: hypothetical protein VFE46_11375 [Pirellulales bacterium]|jgi:hypothetical protein|nr:hypothetical protein [Pirellulales bacterium]
MKLVVIGAMAYATVLLCVYTTKGDEKQEETLPRDDLYHLKLSDDSIISIRANIQPTEGRQSVQVSLVRHPKNTHYDKQPSIWSTVLTTFEYLPGPVRAYALVKETKEKVFVYCLWNSQYFTLETATGRIINKGEGDETLKDYAALAPVKLLLIPPSTGRKMSEQEFEDFEKWEADSKRHGDDPIQEKDIAPPKK